MNFVLAGLGVFVILALVLVSILFTEMVLNVVFDTRLKDLLKKKDGV